MTEKQRITKEIKHYLAEMVNIEDEYTPLRRFYAWVGFLFLVALASVLLYFALCYCIEWARPAGLPEGEVFISSYAK